MSKTLVLAVFATLLPTLPVAAQRSPAWDVETDQPQAPTADLTEDTAEALDGDPEAGRQMAEKRCAACHGLTGDAIVPAYPDLAGQNQQYLFNAMMAYKYGRRFGGNAGLMRPQVDGMSEQQMADVAAYYSSLGD